MVKQGQGRETEASYKKEVDFIMTFIRSANIDEFDQGEFSFIRAQDKKKINIANALKKQDIVKDRLRGTLTKNDSLAAII